MNMMTTTTSSKTLARPSRIDFDNLDLQAIHNICSSGSLSDLTPQEQQYYSLMEKVRGLRARMRMNRRLVTKAGIIRLLREGDGLTDYQARQVYADALNFFYDTDEVSAKAWRNLYAERLENEANMLFVEGRPKESLSYMKLAAQLRGCFEKQEQEIPQQLLDQKPVVVYTTNPEDLGAPAADRQELERFIDSLPEVPKIVKDQVKEDARIRKFDLLKRMLSDKRQFDDAEEVKD